jgi:endonuclease YncB( thermonuclease family)
MAQEQGMTDASIHQQQSSSLPDQAEKIRLRFASEAPIGHALPPLPIGLLARTFAVIILALAGGVGLARDGAPALNTAGTRILMANVDQETRTLMRRTAALADRLPLAAQPPGKGQSGGRSQTFALAWSLDNKTARIRQHQTREEASLVTASLAEDNPLTARSSKALDKQANGAPPSGTAEQVLSSVNIVDGRTLSQGHFKIRLAGIDLPGPDELCLLLNGMSEPCAKRMATQLELMTRWRQVVCRYQTTPTGEVTVEHLVGQCRIGNTDLGQRLGQVVRKAPSTHGFQQPIRAASL